MGIRLTDCCHSVYPQLPQGELENQKLAKFHSLIKSSVTDLGKSYLFYATHYRFLEQLRKFSWFGIPAMLRPITWKLLSVRFFHCRVSSATGDCRFARTMCRPMSISATRNWPLNVISISVLSINIIYKRKIRKTLRCSIKYKRISCG